MTWEMLIPLAVRIGGLVNVASESLAAVLRLERYLRTIDRKSALFYILSGASALTGFSVWYAITSELFSFEVMVIAAMVVGSVTGFAGDLVKLWLQLGRVAKVAQKARK